jgi:hypothetical protein
MIVRSSHGFLLLSSIGLTLAALALSRYVTRLRQLSLAAIGFGVIGIGASMVAVLYLVTGTIPETDDAPGAVGGSYVVLTIGVYVCLILVGAVISTNHSLPGRWSWLPIGIVLAQFPIFIVAGAIGDTIGSEDTTDGLGLALTGVVWIVLGYSLTLASPSRGVADTEVADE